MKKVEAIIQPFMLHPVLDALHLVEGVSGVTTSEVHGFDMKTVATYERNLRLRLEIFIPDAIVARVVETIQQHAHTGNPGDGHVFVLPVEEGRSIGSGAIAT